MRTDRSGLKLDFLHPSEIAFKLDFKQNCAAAGGSVVNSSNTSSLGLGPVSPTDSQQFNIFPAIFSRQLNFSASNCNQQKFMLHNSMEELRPNLVGGLLGLQQGLIEDHNQLPHNNSDTKFMSLQENHNRYENRLLGLSQESRNSSLASLAGNTSLNLPNGNDTNKSSNQRKCSSTPEDFNSLYGSTLDNTHHHHHHHTPAHTPPNRLNDHGGITGEKLIFFLHLIFVTCRELKRHKCLLVHTKISLVSCVVVKRKCEKNHHHRRLRQQLMSNH